MKNIIYFVSAILFLLYGCSSVNLTNEFFKPITITDNSQALIYIYWPNHLTSKGEFNVYIDGIGVCTIEKNCYFGILLQPGDHLFSINRNINPLASALYDIESIPTFNYKTPALEGGKTYYIKCIPSDSEKIKATSKLNPTLSSGEIDVNVYLQIEDQAIAEYEIQYCKRIKINEG